MSIKKALKKERGNRRRDIILSIFLMIVIAYLVVILVKKEVLTGFDVYFSFIYIVGIDILLLINILKTLSEEKISFEVKEDKLEIDGGYFSPNFTLPLNRIFYVDVQKISKKDFSIILVTKKSNKKKFKDFDELYIKNKYVSALEYIRDTYDKQCKFSYIEIKNSGTRKYYLLYVLYKNTNNIEFSREAMDYIIKFVNEYKL